MPFWLDLFSTLYAKKCSTFPLITFASTRLKAYFILKRGGMEQTSPKKSEHLDWGSIAMFGLDEKNGQRVEQEKKRFREI